MLSRPPQPFSFPGCPASPFAPPAAALLATGSATVVTCGLPGCCHDQRLGKFAFADGTRVAPPCARVTWPSLRSLLPVAPWFLCCDSPLYLPSDRVCVCISQALPWALASQTILPSVACGLHTCSSHRPSRRASRWLLRSDRSFSTALGLMLSAPFHPASGVDVQSRPRGRCCSSITRRVGNYAQHRTVSCRCSPPLLIPRFPGFEQTNRTTGLSAAPGPAGPGISSRQ